MDELTRNRLVERVIERMTSTQQSPRSTGSPQRNQNQAQIRPSAEITPEVERPRSPEVERNQGYQSTINRLLSVIENKFLDIVILIDGSDSFNQINDGK